MGEDVLDFVRTSRGRIFPGEVIRGTLPMWWASDYSYLYGRDTSLGNPFVESGVDPEVFDD